MSYGGALALSKYLKVCRGLVELDISGSSITCEGLQLILEATQTNTVLKTLILSNNNRALTISKFLKVNTVLTEIDLCKKNSRDEGIQYIADALQVNTTLTL